MQQEVKIEAYRMECVRKSVETACFDKCIPAPSNALAVLAKGMPHHVPFLQDGPDQDAVRTAHDLSSEEALCIDRCSWKYMLTAKIVLQTLNKAKHMKDPDAGKR